MASNLNVFSLWPYNRQTFPTRWALVCEDDLRCQIGLLEFFVARYGPQGDILIHTVSNAIAAWCVYVNLHESLGEPIAILVDHDMPHGNGRELISALREIGYRGPIVATSGVEANNNIMLKAGADCVASGKGADPKLAAYFNQFDKMESGRRLCIYG